MKLMESYTNLNKKLGLLLGFLIICTVFFLLPQVVQSESLDSIYNEIKAKFPDEIQKMKTNGASEDDIKYFINSLEDKLRQEDNLTDDNVKLTVAFAIVDLYLEDEYNALFDAIFNGWNLSPGSLLTAFENGGPDAVLKLLPKSFEEIGQLVKVRLIAVPNNDNGSGAGTGGGTLEGEIPLADSSLINSQITDGRDQISLSISSSKDMLVVKGNDVEKIIAAKKSLEILSTQGDVVFTIQYEVLKQFLGGGIKIIAQKLSASVADELTKNLNPEAKRASAVYELSIEPYSDNRLNIVFSHPVDMAISYGKSFLTMSEEDNLAVYCFNENSGKWMYIGGSIDKAKKIVSWSAFHFSKYTIISGGPGITFADISTHWAKKDIEYLAAKGIINGVKEDTFEPNRKITRAEFVKMLVNVLSLDLNEISNKNFTDVVENSWYYKYVAAASNAGLVKGVSETLFAPNSPITRQEMAMMAVNSLKLKSKLIFSDQEKGINRDQFKDASDISNWAKDACLAALENGIITGREKNLLAPIDDTTRAESAVIIRRLIDKLK